jgi:cytosine/creatinine deaminase
LIDLLITNARITDHGDLVDIGIDGQHIEAVEPGIEAEAGRVVDAGGDVVMPGFLEPHIHIDKALLFRRRRGTDGTLAEALRITAELKTLQERGDVLARSRKVLDMAVGNGTVGIRAHPDVDPIQGLIGVETALTLRDEYRELLDLEVVAFPEEGLLAAAGTYDLLVEAMSMGASVVGGVPVMEPTLDASLQHVDQVFEIAQRFNAPVDIHSDFGDDTTDGRYMLASYIAQKAIDLDYVGRVSLGHVTALGSLAPEEAKPIIELLARAKINIVVLPATDLYMSGRGDTHKQRRGLAPIRLLREAGVNVTFSSNNIRNHFTPFGKADILQIANLLAHTAQFGSPEDQEEILRMGTYGAAQALGLDSYGIAPGAQADLVILDTDTVGDVLAEIPLRRTVIKRGRVTVEARVDRTIHRTHDLVEKS